MYLSLFVGPFARGAQDDVAIVDMCVEQSARAAEAGFAMVTLGEQHFSNYEPHSNPFIMAGRLASSLGDAWFGTTIVPLPFHHPLRLAEDSSLVDLLLRGRFILGLSAARIGPMTRDWDSFGLDQADRDALYASNLKILTDAFAFEPGRPPVRYETKWGSGAVNGRLMPVSWRAGGPLIAIGTSTDSTIEQTGVDGRPVFLGPCPAGVAAAKFARHRAAMAGAGWSDEQIATAGMRSLVGRNVVVADTEDEAWELAERLSGDAPFMDRRTDGRSMREMAEYDLSGVEFAAAGQQMRADPVIRNSTYVQGWLTVGDPASVARQIKEYESLGIAQVNVRFAFGVFDPDRGTPAVFARSFDLFMSEVLPQLDSQQFPAPAPDETRAAFRV